MYVFSWWNFDASGCAPLNKEIQSKKKPVVCSGTASILIEFSRLFYPPPPDTRYH